MAAGILAKYPQNMPQAFTEKEWLILATGSSLNAAKSAKYYIQQIADVQITIEEPFNYTYYEKLSPHLDLVIGISQSGESTSTIDAVETILKQRHIKTFAVTGNLESELAQLVDQVIDIDSGEELVGYVTKGFFATVLTLMLTGLHYARTNNLISVEREQAELAAFAQGINMIPAIIDQTEQFYETWKHEFISAPRFTAVAYGGNIGTSKEMETKFSETVRVPSQGIELEAFMHGPYLEVNPEHRIFFIETESVVKERMELLRAYEEKCSNYIYTVKFGASDNPRVLALPVELNEFQSPLMMMIPFQILAHHIAELKGNNLTQRIYTDFGVSVKSKTKPGNYA